MPGLARPARLSLSVVLVAAAMFGLRTTAAHAASRHDVLTAAARYARSHGYHIGISVYDTKTGGIADAGDARGAFASESIVKVFIAARLLVEGRMHGSTRRAAYKMITQSDDAIASSLYGSVGGDSLINWVKAHYDVPGLGSPPHRAGWWGNTHITPHGLVRLYAKLKADRKVSPWLLDAMHHATRYGSDGFYQFFGIPSATQHAAIKQGWGTDFDPPGASADQNTTGFVNHDRYAVAILARGPVSTYGSAIGSMLTHVARIVLPNGHYPDPTPTITSMSAHHGSEFGGTRITIHGTDFTHVTSVRFGAHKGSHVHVISPHTLAVTTPKHQDRPIYARVHTTHGHSLKRKAARFRYVPAPLVSTLSVRSGPAKGGTSVQIHGSGFDGPVKVLFGAVPAASVKKQSSSDLVAVSPRHAADTVHIRVGTGCCTSPRRAADKFTFVGPVIKSVSPQKGPRTGGTAVTINGRGFGPGTVVTFGAHPAAAVTVSSATQIVATSPAHHAETVHIRVRTPDGLSAKGSGDRFTFIAS
jgi:hypothetical protein